MLKPNEHFLNTAKLLVASIALFASALCAAEKPEATELIKTLKTEQLVKTALVETNKYQMEKRLVASEGKKDKELEAKLNNFAQKLEELLDWNEIKPLVVESIESEFSPEETQRLTQFLKTDSGQIYVNDYQSASIPMSFALDGYIDTIVDQAFDDGKITLEKIKEGNDSELTTAKNLIDALTVPEHKAALEDKREQMAGYIKKFQGELKGDDKNKAESAINSFNELFNYEQILLQQAQVLKQEMSNDDIKNLLSSIESDDHKALLQRLAKANNEATQTYSMSLMGSKDLSDLMMELM